MVQMIRVIKSGNVEEVGYKAAKKELLVRFKGPIQGKGPLYVYSDADSDVHTGLMSADSIGGWLNKNIKGKLKFRRVTAAEEAEVLEESGE